MKCFNNLWSPLASQVVACLAAQLGLASAVAAPLPSPTQILVDLHDDTNDADEAQLEALLQGIDLRLNSPHAADERLFIADVTPEKMPELLRILKKDPRVEYAEPNYIYSLPIGETDILTDSVSPIETSPEVQRGPLPNDPLWNRQWSFKMINVPQAWARTDGSGVTVAVIDTGVAFEKYKKFKKVEDLDTDRFVEGYNFLTDTPHANDDHGHGTHVAGTIAQTTFNATGVAGIAYKAKIMPLKVLSRRGSGTAGDIADAIRFAADYNAQVMNLSLGGGPRSAIMASAVAYARKKGVIVICAAGNGGRARVEYPAAYPGAFAVSSVGPTKRLAYYSSYGPEVAIAGPGGDKQLGGDEGGILQNTISPNQVDRTNLYMSFQGTSMATPHVAGVAALVISAGITNPDRVEAILKETAEDLGPHGPDDRFGHGLVNAAAAVQAAHNALGGTNHLFAAILTWVSLLMAATLRLGRNALLYMIRPGTILSMILSATGWSILPGWFGWALPAWFGFHALWASCIPMLLLTLFGLGFRFARPLLIGLSVGWAAHLAATCLMQTRDVVGIYGISGFWDQLWLGVHALLLILLAVQTLKVSVAKRTP